MVVFGTLTSIGVLSNGGAPLLLTLLPAVGAAIAIALALVFALGDTPPEPHGGKLRTAFGRAHRFVHSGARTSVELLRHGDPLLIFGATTYFAFDVAALACAFEAFGGGGPPIGAFVLAYTLGHAGAFLPTPGGVGGVEGGLIGMFVAFGSPIGLAATAVLAYRVFQLGMPAILGAISLLRIRHVLAHPPPREEVAARFAGHSQARPRIPIRLPRHIRGAPASPCGLITGLRPRPPTLLTWQSHASRARAGPEALAAAPRQAHRPFLDEP